ncbi:DUF3857 domain-containing protein [bacterium]|nr:DUF3857 domain-containing protein [bacterium]MBU1637049.1 DUF3857 domain-containing protein [bacterium]MBU1920787.1 DUF3857 domain-containing protein [bacterium]
MKKLSLVSLTLMLLYVSASTLFAQTDLDRLIDECPGLETYPQASVVHIFSRSSAMLDADGFEHAKAEQLIKILDERAKDVYGDQSIRFDADKDTVIIESARTRLPDGTWIDPEADAFTLTSAPEVQWASAYSQLKQQNISFPGLDVGAAIYLSYRIEPKPGVEAPKRLQAGGVHLFGGMNPYLEQAYTLDVYPPWQVQYELQNSDALPLPAMIEGGTRYQWKFENTEQLIMEPDMVSPERLLPRLLWTSFRNWEELGLFISEPFWESVDESDKAIEEYLKEVGLEFRGKPALMNTAFWNLINIRPVNLRLGSVGYEPNTANKVWANRYGHDLDKAVLFTALLGHYGLDVIPVLVQNSSAPFCELPVLEQFGHILLAVPLAGDTIWIELSDQYYPPSEIPYSATQGTGCMLTYGAPMLVPIAPLSHADRKSLTLLKAQLSEDGTLTGTASASPKADFAARARRIFKDQKAQEREIYFQRIASTFGQGTKVTDSGNSDPALLMKEFEVSFDFSCGEYAVIQDDLMLLERPRNPFSFALTGFYPSLPEVRYPIELPARGTTETVIEITLPANYKVAYLPAPLIVVNPYLQLTLIPKQEANKLTWTQTLEIIQDRVPVADYEALREAFQALALPKNSLTILERAKE